MTGLVLPLVLSSSKDALRSNRSTTEDKFKRSNGSIARAVANVITLNLLRKKYRRWEQVSITS